MLPLYDPNSNLQCPATSSAELVAEIGSQLQSGSSSGQTDVSGYELCSLADGLLCNLSDLGVCSNVDVVTSQHCSPCHAKQKEIASLSVRLRKSESKVRSVQRQLKSSQKKCQRVSARLDKFLNPDQLKMMTLTSSRGSKWSSSTVQKALQFLFACGPTGYNLLRSHGFPLPGTRTLRHKLQGVKFDSGVLLEVFHLMKVKVESMNEKERHCALTIDEMSISQSVEYDTRSGRLLGSATLPGHSGKATHAMVFMLAGISTRWKQVVAYYFTGNSVFGSVMKPIVINIVNKASEIGLTVLTVTTDMGACNRAMWNSFGINCGRLQKLKTSVQHPSNTKSKLYFLADAPHVIKNLKAAMVNGQDVVLPDWVVTENSLPSNIVSASHLQMLLDFQKDLQLKLSPGLTSKTLTPSHFDKMKVSNAMSFFSHSNAAGLEYLVHHEQFPSALLTTAWFLKTVNRWFDLVSSRRRVISLSLAVPEKYKEAVAFLQSVIRIFETISIGSKGDWKPVQTGVMITTRSILDVSDELLRAGYGFVLTSRFTSDCIENLFSCVRTNNAVPTPLEFKNKLRLLCMAQFLQVKSSSSYQIDDDGKFLVDLVECKKNSAQSDDDQLIAEEVSFSDTVSIFEAEYASLYYLAGYIVSRVLKSNTTCSSCRPIIGSAGVDSDNEHASLLKLKSYRDGCLVIPSQQSLELVQTAEVVFRATNLNLLHHRKNVQKFLIENIFAACMNITMPSCHPVRNFILKRFVTLRLRIWTKDQQALLKSDSSKMANGELGSKSMAMSAAVKKFK